MIGKLFAPLGMKIASGLALGAFLALGVVMWRADAISAQRDALRTELAHADAKIVLLEADAALKDTAGVERVQDSAEVARIEEELIDAIQSVPDEKPDAVRVHLGCERLRRREGYLDTDLPAVCRPDGGAETGPRT